MKLQAGQKLVMIGDSITDCGRKFPVGEGLFDGLGHGYVSLVDSLIACRFPERHIRVVNMGTSGNTVRDLSARWQTDVIDLHPDWVSVLIGINDVWRQFDQPLIPESHVDVAEYETTLCRLVDEALEHSIRVVLMTPFFIESNREDAMRQRMDEYASVVRRVAEGKRCLLVDVQAAIDNLLVHFYSGFLAADRVHPSQVGHMQIARAFLEVME